MLPDFFYRIAGSILIHNIYLPPCRILFRTGLPVYSYVVLIFASPVLEDYIILNP